MEYNLLSSQQMRHIKSTLLAALIVLPIAQSSTAHAYNASKTHRWLTLQAVELLVSVYPGQYDEVLEHVDQLVEGSFHEDDLYADGDQDPTTLRVMRHFYHAPDQMGLTFSISGVGGIWPNSYQWNGEKNEQNEWDYYDGMEQWQRGNIAEALFIAGHTAHLIQDLTVPAHTHLDDHGPPYGDNYEQHCSGRTISATEANLKTVAPGTPLPVFASLSDAFQKTANASYYRNSYPGHLSEDGEAYGVIKDMFPEIGVSWLTGEWTIPGVGKLNKGFEEESPGYYYFSINTVPSKYDVIDYDASQPEDRVFGPIASDTHMVERMADDLVPVAILHSAAVIKMFVDEARALPPIDNEVDMPPEEEYETASAGCNAIAGSSGLLSAFCLLLFVVALRRQD